MNFNSMLPLYIILTKTLTKVRSYKKREHTYRLILTSIPLITNNADKRRAKISSCPAVDLSRVAISSSFSGRALSITEIFFI